jgi:hypothetical protein
VCVHACVQTRACVCVRVYYGVCPFACSLVRLITCHCDCLRLAGTDLRHLDMSFNGIEVLPSQLKYLTHLRVRDSFFGFWTGCPTHAACLCQVAGM